MLGSVTERVSRTAAMPVLVIGVQNEAADKTTTSDPDVDQSIDTHDNAADGS